jgi:hypothetical protein
MALAMPKLHNTRESGHFPSSESKSCAVQVGHRNGCDGHSGPDRQSEDPGQEAADSEAAHRGDSASRDRDAEEQPVGPHRSVDLSPRRALRRAISTTVNEHRLARNRPSNPAEPGCWLNALDPC